MSRIVLSLCSHFKLLDFHAFATPRPPPICAMRRPMTVQAEVDCVGRVATPGRMVALERRDDAAAMAFRASQPAPARVAIGANDSAITRQERGRIKLAAAEAINDHCCLVSFRRYR
jgi:hypothetical protein